MGTHFSFIFMGHDPYIEGLKPIVFPWGTWGFLRYPLKENRDFCRATSVLIRGHPTSCWLPSCPRGCWTSSWQPPLHPVRCHPQTSQGIMGITKGSMNILKFPHPFLSRFLFSTHEVAATKMNADSSRRGNMTWYLWLFCHLLRW